MKNKKQKNIITFLFTILIVTVFYFYENFSPTTPTNSIEKRVEESKITTEEKLDVTFLDVGQADSILLENKGHSMLIDAGNNEDGEKLVTYFQEQGINNFDYVIGTHPHEDHIGGLDDIIKNFGITTFYMPDVITTTKTFEEVLDALEEKNLKLSIPKKNDTFYLGDATIKVLYIGGEEEKDLNDTSIILKVTYQDISFLFTGDASTKVEKSLNKQDLPSTVLKLGHHGSSTATNEEFLTAVNPTYAIISAGKNNQYNHPHTKVLELLKNHNIKVYRTDENGSIKMTTDGTKIEINTIKTNTNG